jgi:hypothetical protein
MFIFLDVKRENITYYWPLSKIGSYNLIRYILSNIQTIFRSYNNTQIEKEK